MLPGGMSMTDGLVGLTAGEERRVKANNANNAKTWGR